MDIEKDSLKKQIREMTQLGYIAPEDLPSIELYMDQVTTFMDKYLSQNKRYEEDKTLTKTMINNYTKNNLLPPPEKKRYTKEHLILLIYIYYLKNVVSINDIQIMLKPLIDHYFENPEAAHSLEEIYASLYKLEQRQHFRVENSIMKTFELSERDFYPPEDKRTFRSGVLNTDGDSYEEFAQDYNDMLSHCKSVPFFLKRIRNKTTPQNKQ